MRSPGIVAYALACMIAGAGIGGWLIFKERASDQAEVQRRAMQLEQLDRLLDGAVQLAHKGDWRGARAELLELRARNAQFSAARVDQLLQAATKEIANQENLELGRFWVEKRELAQAARALSRVSLDTAQVHPREELQKEIALAANARAAEAAVLTSWTDDRAKMLELQALTDDILAAIPEHRQAATLRVWAQEALVKLDLRDELAASKTPWLDVQDYFRTGEVEVALTLAELCSARHPRCKTLLPVLQRFSDELDGEEDEARLLRLERQILGPGGGYWQALALVDKARSAKERGSYKSALSGALKALDISPGHLDAGALVAELRELAADLYMQTEDGPVEDEIQRLRHVVALTEPDDEYHQLARERLADLKR